MAKKHFIFDVSGTIWNDLDQVFEANYLVLKRQGYSVCPNVFENGYAGKPLSVEALKANAVGSCAEAFRRFGMQGSDEYLTQLYVDALDPASEEYPVDLYDGMLELLINLHQRNQSMSVVSSHPQHRLDIDFERLGIKQFKLVKGSSHNKKSDIISHASHFADQFSDVYYIGDTQSDMMYANEAKVVPIGVSYGYQPRDKVLGAKPLLVLDTVKELRNYIFSQI